MSFADFKLIGLNRFPTSLYMWGDNTNGLLGDNRTPSYFSWSKISSGGLHTVAIRNDGLLFAWGRNTEGQLGDATTIHRSSPVQIGTSSWNSVSAGLSHTVAIGGDNTLWTWGSNRYGQLGDSTTINKSAPAQLGTTAATGNSTRYTSGTMYLSFPGITVGTSAYTAEMWFYLTDGTFPTSRGLIGPTTRATNAFNLRLLNATTVSIDQYVNSAQSFTVPTMIANVWYHFVAVRNGAGTTTVFLNGVRSSTGTVPMGFNYNNAFNALGGVPDASAIFLPGYISNFRFVLGTAVYDPTLTTLTIPTAPLTAVAGTQLLLSQATTFVDGSVNNYTITNNGIVTISAFGPFGGAALLYNALSAGGNHTIAITIAGQLFTWGLGNSGQLGGSSSVAIASSRSSPVQVGTGNSWLAVSAGKTHTVALATDNTLYAWGDNTYGELGDSTTVNRSSPIQIGTNSWSQISAGGTHTASIDTTGSLLTWGLNSTGQLGLNTSYSGSYWTQVSEGPTHTLAIRNDGILFVWGRNQLGQLGTGDTADRSSPIQIGSGSWNSVDAGSSHSLAIRSDGKLFAWGSNVYGQLGNNPDPIIGSWNKILLSNGTNSTFGIKNDGTLWAWGGNNNGRLGDGTVVNRNSPVQIGSLTTWSNVANGPGHTLGITTDGALYTWGFNSSGQLGDNSTINKSSPTQIGIGLSYTKIFAGASTSVAVDNNNIAYVWGANNVGQLGLADTINRSNPIQLNSNTWSSFSLYEHTLGIKTDNTLWVWGNNNNGQLGLNDLINRSSPVQLGTSSWTKVGTGYSITVALSTNNSIWSWGFNTNGQLGLGDTINRSSPVQIGTDSWTDISVGSAFAFGISTTGTLWGWGYNSSGPLGLNDIVSRSNPTQITTLNVSGISQLSAGASHVSVISNTGILYMWGWNTSNQIDGTGATKSSPIQVGTTIANYSSPIQIGTANWNKVSAGEGHSLGLSNDGILFGWGKNDQGQIGGQLNTLGIGWSKVVIGPTHSLGIRFDGRLYSWGNNSLGQLGDNTVIAKSSPVLLDSANTWKDITVGKGSLYYSMAIRNDGKLFGWGNNSVGQLGWLSWRQVSAGSGHSLLIRSDGALFGWGLNNAGQVGDTSLTYRSSPVQIGTSSWSVISAGVSTSAAIDTVGRLFAWGYNNNGAVGDTSTITRSSPAILLSGSWTQVSVQDYGLAISSQGSLWVWGNNNNGQLGLGTTVNVRAPALLDGSTSGYSVAFNGSTDFLSLSSNSAFAFGTGNFTIEMWIFQPSTSATSVLLDMRTADTANAGFDLFITLSRLSFGTAGTTYIAGTTILVSGTWYHVAVARSSTTVIKMFLNGVQEGPTYTASATQNFTNNTPRIGNGVNGFFIGYISNLRVVKGQALYTSTFTVPSTSLTTTSQSALAANVSLLTGQNSTIIDNSTANAGVGFTITSNGTPIVSQHNPFTGITSTGSTSWSKVSTGTNSLAIRSNGTLYTWGQNNYGQLGDSTTINKSSPIQIGTGSWTLISSSMTGHNLAVDTTSMLFVWGNNTYGELGLNNEFINVSSPVQVSTTLSFVSINAGNNTSLGLTSLNNITTLYGWGINDYNQLANINAYSWRSVGVGTGIQAPIGVTFGKLYTWGNNTYGQLGNNTTITRSSPTQVGGFAGSSTYKFTVNNTLNTAFIGNDNSLFMMGDNTYGQLGQGDTISRSSPVQVGAAGIWSTVAISGTGHILAITLNGTLFAWGRNEYNELGQVDTVSYNRSTPVIIGNNADWVQVSAGDNYSVALTVSNAMYTWGRNDSGQLGISNPLSYTNIGAGIASRNDGKMYTWGINDNGQLGNNTGGAIASYRSAPVQIDSVAFASTSWTSVSGSSNNKAGIKIDGKLFVWGDNRYGQLGVSEDSSVNPSRSQPVQILGSWTQLYVNTDNMFAIRNDNTLWAWGNNNIGQLGDGTTINRNSPIQIGLDNNWSSVVASATGHVLGLKSTGQLFAWGNNQYNELGQNQRVQVAYSSPIQVGTSSWTKVSAGNNNSFAIRTDGALFGWGRNDYGQIGNTILPALSWTQVAGGDSYSVAIRSDGKLFSWGRNDKGQLGLGHTVNKSAPTQIGISTNSTYYSTSFTSNDFLTIPTNAGFVFGTGDFTIEAWFYITSNTSAVIFDTRSGPIGLTPLLYINTLTLRYYINGSDQITSTTTLALNTWYHVALVRSSSSSKMYLNGLQTGNTYADTNNFTLTNTIYIGRANEASNPLTGYITSLRVVKGQALYTNIFAPSTIPVTTTSQGAIAANVSLLACQNNAYTDNSTATVKNITPNGASIGVITLTPFQLTTYNYSFTQVSATLSHTVAIRNDGTLWAWGANNSGQLGQDDTTTRSAPVQIGSSSWTSVGTGNDASFAIRTDSALFAWGDNTNGILGQGDTLTRSSPVQIGTSSWTSVSATQHAIGITTANTMFAWGLNSLGQLGDATTVSKSSPVQVQLGFSSSLLTYNSATAVDNSGNAVTLTATGAPTIGNTIIPFSSTYSVNFPTNTYYTTGSLPALGTQYTFEFWVYVTGVPSGNWYWTFVGGSLPMFYFVGNGSAVTSLGKVNNGGGGNFSGSVSLALNTWAHVAYTRNASNLMTIWLNGTSVATSSDGTGYTGGAFLIGYPAGGNGGAGNGYLSNFRFINNTCLYTTAFTPPTTALAATATSSAFTFTKASAGTSHGVAIRNDSGLFTWGSGVDGRLGNGLTTNRSFAVQIGASSWTQINAGSSWTLGVLTTGGLYSWGAGANGELGNGTTSRSSPVQVGLLTTWGVLTGKTHALSITTAGALFTWGTNTVGQLGDSTTVVKSSPVGVAALTSQVFDNVSSPTQIGSSSWTQVAAGDLFTNALRAVDGGLFTWGYGINGRLGSSVTTSRSSPVQVGTSSWIAISTGGTENTVALTLAYTLFSWGRNNYGQVGDATTVDKSAPTAVGSLLNQMTNIIKTVTQVGTSSWTQISAGDSHTMAIRLGSGLFTWGKADFGQLGSSATTNRSSPVQVGTTSWSIISASISTSAAITTLGNLQTWGRNINGQLGDNSTVNRSAPVQIGTSSWTSISSGANSMIGTTLSNVTFVWGTNNSGQLGLGDTLPRSSPVQLGSSLLASMYQTVYPSPVIVNTATTGSWVAVGTGDTFSVGIDNIGRLYAWGRNNTGQLGDGTTVNTTPAKSSPTQIATTANSFTFINTSSPIQISAGTSWMAVSAGGTHTVAVRSDGTLWSWGVNTFGQVGTLSTFNQLVPKQIDIYNSFTSIATGTDFSVAIKNDLSLWRWGFNSTGDLSSPHRSNPVQVGNSSFTQISVAGATALAIDVGGRLFGWGKITTDDNFYFNLGLDPITWGVGKSHININAGDSFIHAIDNQYAVWAYGLNNNGQLGDSTTVTRSSPVQLGANYSWSIIGNGIGGTPLYAGALFLAGLNTSGQLGLSDLANRSSPVQLSASNQSVFNFPVRIGTNRWNIISAGYSHSMAIRDDSTLWGWGLNASGQLGDTVGVSRSSPTQVGTSSWVQVSAGKDHTGGVKLDNTLWTWGLNTRGQLGDSTTVNKNSPVQVAGYWNDVSVGASHTTALADNNTLYVWGDDNFGQ